MIDKKRERGRGKGGGGGERERERMRGKERKKERERLRAMHPVRLCQPVRIGQAADADASKALGPWRRKEERQTN